MMGYRMISMAIALLQGLYLFFFLRRTVRFYGADVKKKGIVALNLVLASALAYLCMDLLRTRTVIMLHFIFISIAIDIAALLVRMLQRNKVQKKPDFCKKIYQSGLLPVLAAGLVFIYGFYNINHIRMTSYQIRTDKNVKSCRIALFTDVHYDTVQNPEVLKHVLSDVEQQNPDLIILGGDIVEEGTSREKMQEVFQIFGSLKSTYGIYFVFGNHDRQPYTLRRTFADDELVRAVRAGGIQILEDECVEIGDDFILAGRDDAAWGATRYRASVEEILQGADPEKYIIMADHQPIAAEENEEQKVDLLLSGHTHAGQIWPTGYFSGFADTFNYGRYQAGKLNVIVSSGVAGWKYNIRTGQHCEYVIVDILGKK